MFASRTKSMEKQGTQEQIFFFDIFVPGSRDPLTFHHFHAFLRYNMDANVGTYNQDLPLSNPF